MKKSSVFSVYLGILAILTFLGYFLDRYLGIYRQAAVGAVLVAIGYLFFGRGQRKGSEKTYKKLGITLSCTLTIACLVLFALVMRLLFAQFVSNTLLSHSDVGFLRRVVATVILPVFYTMELAVIVERMQVVTHPVAKMLFTGMCFLPFCSHPLYMASAFVFGAGCFWIKEYFSGKYTLEMFVSYYLIMLFYDTLSISIGSIDFNLTLKMVFSFFLISLSIGILVVYLALRPIKERTFHVAEFLTIFLICAILLLVAIAL